MRVSSSVRSVRQLAVSVRDARIARGLTQAEVSELTGVSRPWINQFEQGRLKNAGIGRVLTLCRVLGIDFAVSYEGPESVDAAQMGGAADGSRERRDDEARPLGSAGEVGGGVGADEDDASSGGADGSPTMSRMPAAVPDRRLAECRIPAVYDESLQRAVESVKRMADVQWGPQAQQAVQMAQQMSQMMQQAVQTAAPIAERSSERYLAALRDFLASNETDVPRDDAIRESDVMNQGESDAEDQNT